MAISHRPAAHLEGAVTQPLTQYPHIPHLPGTQALRNPEPAEVLDPAERLESTELAEHPETAPLFSNTTILLVDDDPDIRALTRTFLEHIGLRVLTSGDANRAAQIFLGAQHVDLLIADQNMPGRSGMDLAFQLKTVDPQLPVLMISGALETASSSLFTQPGWTFLPKPFSLPVLLDTVHRILETAGSPQEPERRQAASA
jgi:two-component system chemotaxis response regulator CheY